MITYHNAGGAGRDYSRLELQDPSCGKEPPMVEFVIAGTGKDVRLNVEQITHMHNALSQFLSTHSAGFRPLIEGTSL
jgi:hypothetical protein